MLRVNKLGVAFRQHNGQRLVPLDGIDLELLPGEVVGLVGSSGAGKSLIAEALCGLLPRNAEVVGQVTIDGAPPRPGEIALAPQGVDALDPLASVGRQIRRFAQLAGRNVETAGLLRRLGLPPDAAAAFPYQLSGGMAKRALIATALATGSRWIVADEPSLGLDPVTADRILALIAGLASEGRGVLIISHDLPRLVQHASRVTILRNGRMVECAPQAAFTQGGLKAAFSRDLWNAQSWTERC